MATYWAIVILAATTFVAQTANAQDRAGPRASPESVGLHRASLANRFSDR